MDGIAAINERMAEIRSTIAGFASRSCVASSGATASAVSSTSTASSGSTSATEFASALATQVSAQAASATAAYSSTQLTNASAIVAAGQSMGLSLRDQAIGVMTAMGESSLQVLEYGDAAGPDSRGLFQQRANGAWGSLEDRLNPTTSAKNFFSALTRVGNRDTMAPTLVAHAVQRNADAQHYAKYWDGAVAIVSRLTGATAAQINGA